MTVDQQTNLSIDAFMHSLACPICLGSLEHDNRRVLLCQLCNADFPVRAGFPSFVTPRVLKLLASRGVSESLLTRWAESMQSTYSWRNKKDSHARSRAPFSRKLTEGHRLDPEVVYKLLDLIHFAKSKWVLDLGCGTGFRANHLPDSNYLGLDPCVAAINNGVPFVQGIAECLPLQSSFFDVLLSIDVLDHLISPDLAMAEILRVIKPDGCLYLIVGDAGDEAYLLHKQSRQMFGIPEVKAHLHQFDPSFFQMRLGSAFSELEIHRSKGYLFVHGQGKLHEIN